MAEIHEIQENGIGTGIFIFTCPGCKIDHAVHTKFKNNCGAMWSFDGNRIKPTFNPSLLVRWPRPNKGDMVCHSFIRNGKIEFLSDCTHPLAGQTVDIPPYED